MARVLVGVKRVIDYAVKVSTLTPNLQKKQMQPEGAKVVFLQLAIFLSRSE